MINILMNQRIHRLSKLPDDGDPWAPNNLLTPEQKKNTSWTPVGQVDETVGRDFFRFAQHPPDTRFDAMYGFFDYY